MPTMLPTGVYREVYYAHHASRVLRVYLRVLYVHHRVYLRVLYVHHRVYLSGVSLLGVPLRWVTTGCTQGGLPMGCISGWATHVGVPLPAVGVPLPAAGVPLPV